MTVDKDEHRKSCLTKSRTNTKIQEKMITPAGGRLTTLMSKKLSRNSACLSPPVGGGTTGTIHSARSRDGTSRGMIVATARRVTATGTKIAPSQGNKANMNGWKEAICTTMEKEKSKRGC